MDSHVAKALDYQKVAKSHPYYRYNKILPISGSQSFALTSSGGTEIQFEIPVCAFNLAQSYLQFEPDDTRSRKLSMDICRNNWNVTTDSALYEKFHLSSRFI